MSKDVKEEFLRLCMRSLNLSRGSYDTYNNDNASQYLRIEPMFLYWFRGEGLCVTVPGPQPVSLRVPIFNETDTPDIPQACDLPMMTEYLPVLRRHLVLDELADV